MTMVTGADSIGLERYYLRVDIRNLEQRITEMQGQLDSLRAELADVKQPQTALVLEQLPNGEVAWLRPDRECRS